MITGPEEATSDPDGDHRQPGILDVVPCALGEVCVASLGRRKSMFGQEVRMDICCSKGQTA